MNKVHVHGRYIKHCWKFRFAFRCWSNTFDYHRSWLDVKWFIIWLNANIYPVGWCCRIQRHLLGRRVRPLHPSNEYPGYHTKQSADKASVMRELWRIWNTPLLPSFPGLLVLGVVAPDRVQSMDQIKLNCRFILNWIVCLTKLNNLK